MKPARKPQSEKRVTIPVSIAPSLVPLVDSAAERDFQNRSAWVVGLIVAELKKRKML